MKPLWYLLAALVVGMTLAASAAHAIDGEGHMTEDGGREGNEVGAHVEQLPDGYK